MLFFPITENSSAGKIKFHFCSQSVVVFPFFPQISYAYFPYTVSLLQQRCVDEESDYSLLPTSAEPVKRKVSVCSDHCQAC